MIAGAVRGRPAVARAGIGCFGALLLLLSGGCVPTKEEVRTALRSEAAPLTRKAPTKQEFRRVVRKIEPAAQTDVSWAMSGMKIVRGFEGGFGHADSHYLGKVTGDFDCQGISLGVSQWNIGQQSLSRILRDTPARTVDEIIREHAKDRGEEIRQALYLSMNDNTLPEALRMVRRWQANSAEEPCRKNRRGVIFTDKLVQRDLQNVLLSPDIVLNQNAEIIKDARRADSLAVEWRRSFGSEGPPDIRERLVFLDFIVQNGGMKGLHGGIVKDFIDDRLGQQPGAGSDRKKLFLDHVESWAGSLAVDKHSREALRNIARWRRDIDRISEADIYLLALAYLRADRATKEYAAVVFNRKGLLALGYGYIYGSFQDFRPDLAVLARKLTPAEAPAPL
ncbi:hypothetical protein OIU35_19265 [Boseaceae bacterium BT-24-1]|nr:hypothetical protein [Boseaceae bacterium BT-24-1]